MHPTVLGSIDIIVLSLSTANYAAQTAAEMQHQQMESVCREVLHLNVGDELAQLGVGVQRVVQLRLASAQDVGVGHHLLRSHAAVSAYDSGNST